MDKIVKTRKDHQCGQCGELIPAGSHAKLHESRVPEYEYDKEYLGKQIGIWFNRYWRHIEPCLDENGELITVKNDQK